MQNIFAPATTCYVVISLFALRINVTENTYNHFCSLIIINDLIIKKKTN